MIEYKYRGTGKYDNDWVDYDENDHLGRLFLMAFVGFVLGLMSTASFLGGVIVGIISLFFSLFSIVPQILNHDGYKGKIFLYDRYFTLNDCYVYYLNISHIERDDEKGQLVVRYFIGDKKEKVIVKKEKFPTGARKDFKIEANKKAKFNKVSEKIISRARAANPDIEVIVKEVKKEVEHESI